MSSSMREDLAVRESFLPFALPDIGEEEIASVVETLRSGWLTTGPKVKRFEAAFAEYVGAREAVGSRDPRRADSLGGALVVQRPSRRASYHVLVSPLAAPWRRSC